MSNKTIVRTIAFVALATSLTFVNVAPVAAANSTSLGHGIKCTWVLISSVNGTNTYQQVCRKGV